MTVYMDVLKSGAIIKVSSTGIENVQGTLVQLADDALGVTAMLQDPRAYLYLNNAFAPNPSYAGVLQAQAKRNFQTAVTQQQAAIQAAATSTMQGGFTSKATGHTYPSDLQSQANMTAALDMFEKDATKTQQLYQTLDAGPVMHTKEQLLDVYIEGGRWKDAQEVQEDTLLQQIQTLAAQEGTTIQQIQAITWTPADYKSVAEAPPDGTTPAS